MSRWAWKLRVAAVLTAAAVAAVSSAAALAAPSAPSGTAVSVASLESGVLVEINAFRRSHGLVPLRVSASLASAARQHSQSMATAGYFSHDSADGSSFWRRVQRFYSSRKFGYWSVGENLLWSSPDVAADGALQMWLDSPPHRENLLNPRWREIGISAVHTSAAPGTFHGLDVTIVTADFGVRR